MPIGYAGASGSDTDSHSEAANFQAGGTGGLGTGNALRTVGGTGKVSGSRSTSHTGGVETSGLTLRAMMYSGPARTFDYRIEFDIAVEVVHETGEMTLGWPVTLAKFGYHNATEAAKSGYKYLAGWLSGEQPAVPEHIGLD